MKHKKPSPPIVLEQTDVTEKELYIPFLHWSRGIFIVIVIFLLGIIVAGLFIFFKLSYNQLQPPPQIANTYSTPEPTAAQTTDTSTWKTYTDNDYDISFKYPKNWYYQKAPYSSIFKSGIKELTINFGLYANKNEIGQSISPTIPPAYVGLNIITYSENITNNLQSYINNDQFFVAHEQPNWSTININGIPAQKVTHLACQSGQCEDVIIIKNNVLFDFFVQNGDQDLNQILSTFKFLDQNQTSDTSNWKTYRSSQYGYSFMYPPTLTLEDNQQGNETNTSLKDNTGTEQLSFNGYLGGMGCGGNHSTIMQTFQIGSQSKSISNFCGSNLYIVDTKTDKGKEIYIFIRFMNSANETVGKKILQSIQGLNLINL